MKEKRTFVSGHPLFTAVTCLLCFFLFAVQETASGEPGAQSAARLYAEVTAFPLEQVFDVSHITIVRDAVQFELNSGKIELAQPAGGRYHALVFEGDGIFRFTPPDSVEQYQLEKFTDCNILEEKVKRIVFRFTDSLAEEILPTLRKTSARSEAKGASKELKESRKEILKKYRKNIDSRILRDIVSKKHGYFLALISGKSRGTFLLEIDPEEEESVSLLQHTKAVGREFVDTWASFRMPGSEPEHDSPQRHEDEIEIPDFEVDIDIEKNGNFTATATLDIVSRRPNLQTLPLNFSPLVEIEDVSDDNGPCFFIYETAQDRIGEPAWKQDRLDLFFGTPLQEGEKRKVNIAYKSNDLIQQVERRKEYRILDPTGWYPSYGYLNRSTSSTTYCHPTGVDLVAVGQKTKEWEEKGKTCSTWKQSSPVAIISFMMGDFKHKQLTHEGLPPVDIFAGKTHGGLPFGGSPVDNVAADLMNSLNFFNSVFAQYPFTSIVATEIPGSHGQGFPGFLHLSYGTFEDGQIAGMDESFRAHEVSHQWWGHLVGWKTYHDQWISEGFAEYSGALFAATTLQDQKENLLMKILDSWRNDILYKGNLSFQRYGLPKMDSRLTMGSSSGPIWLGRRLHSSRSPMDYQILVYEKGGFVLHMLRMLLHNFESDNDEPFFEMMRDFIRTYSWKNATTEDFRKTAEKHLGQDLGWFFQQWVYGTAIPKYDFRWRTESEQKRYLILEVSQSGVPDDFEMPVIVRIDFGKDRYAIERLLMDSPEKTFRFEIPEEPQDVQFNYYHSVLSHK